MWQLTVARAHAPGVRIHRTHCTNKPTSMKTRRWYLIGILLVGGLVLLYRYWQFDPPKKASDNTTTTLEPGQTASSSHGPGPSHEEERRRANLKKLRALWDDEIQAYDKNPVITEAQKALAAESVRLLSCTDQLAELIEYLGAGSKTHYGREQFVRLIQGNVMGLLNSVSGSAAARQNLVEMCANPNLRQKWAFEAAKHCSDEEAKEFAKALGDPKCAQAVTFGHCLSIAASDPKQALDSTVAELQKGNLTPFWSADDVLRDVAMSIPLTADFAALEASLPPDSTHSAIQRGRAELLARWCSIDPAAAANHVAQNPGRISPESIRIVIGPFFGQDLPGAIAWVQDFPEGEYKDHALTAAVDRIAYRYPKEARELATLIADPTTRENYLKQVDSIAADISAGRPTGAR